MNDPGTWLPPLIILALLAIPIFYKFTILPEYEQVIIYRLGRFHKLAGPGLVRYSRWLDTLEQRIDTRDRKQSVTLTGMFVYDIPFGFKLDMWMRFDPREIAAWDHETLTRLAHIPENEQISNVRSEVKRALQHSLSQITARYPLPTNPTLIDKLLPIIPGTQICNELLGLVRDQLTGLLPQVGFTLSPNHDFTIFDIILGQDIIDIFNRGRLAKSLRDDIPSINDERIFEFLGKVRGLDIDVKHVIVDNPDGVDMRIRDPEREFEIRTPTVAKRTSGASALGPPPWEKKKEAAGDDSKSTSTNAKNTSDMPNAEPHEQHWSQTNSDNGQSTISIPVTDDDWRVMKAVPHL